MCITSSNAVVVLLSISEYFFLEAIDLIQSSAMTAMKVRL